MPCSRLPNMRMNGLSAALLEFSRPIQANLRDSPAHFRKLTIELQLPQDLPNGSLTVAVRKMLSSSRVTRPLLRMANDTRSTALAIRAWQRAELATFSRVSLRHYCARACRHSTPRGSAYTSTG